MAQNAIAIICDCDGTLCPDSTDKLASSLGLDLGKFWNEVSQMVEAGWDPPLAYLNRLLSLARGSEIEPITREKLGACPTILEEKPLPGPRESCGNLMRPSWPGGSRRQCDAGSKPSSAPWSGYLFGLPRWRQSGSPEFQEIVGQGYQGELPCHLVQTPQQELPEAPGLLD